MSEFDDIEHGTQIALRPNFNTKDVPKLRAYLVVMAGQNAGEMFRVSEMMTIGRSRDCEVRIIDDGVSRRHAQISVSDNKVWVEDVGSTNGVFVNSQRITRHELQDGDRIEVGSTTILKFTFHDQVEEQFQKNMFEAALRDGLTKIYNKRYFSDRITTECAFSLRHGSPLSLLIFDLDRFKQVNDTFGHLAGDFVIAETARRIAEASRREDVLARYGGEELALLCRGLDMEKSSQLAERLRQVIAEKPYPYEGHNMLITTSIGVASMPDSRIHSAKDLIAAADEALYEAKQNGRNRVVSNRG